MNFERQWGEHGVHPYKGVGPAYNQTSTRYGRLYFAYTQYLLSKFFFFPLHLPLLLSLPLLLIIHAMLQWLLCLSTAFYLVPIYFDVAFWNILLFGILLLFAIIISSSLVLTFCVIVNSKIYITITVSNSKESFSMPWGILGW